MKTRATKITAEDIRALRLAASNTGLVSGDEPSLVRQSRKLKGLGLIGQGGFITDAGEAALASAAKVRGI